ncbi:hypothetical protein [Glaciimonas immobilis]|uniref:Uncharacterized protein n=1 Tax=Glaciimonas immobilis TaxID=728004 RepID=A0A840RNR3_9BURK|nr:hypothetical protein [Glaciimonas immobilis]KAF3998884.1 hypothetical protein HAV38_02665 [Glaciimonas immobilis]MBB5198281.1 hypothetical protein [Glaciimonas immobilis]
MNLIQLQDTEMGRLVKPGGVVARNDPSLHSEEIIDWLLNDVAQEDCDKTLHTGIKVLASSSSPSTMRL